MLDVTHVPAPGANLVVSLHTLERIASSGRLNVMLGEKGLAERVINLR